MRTSNLGLPGVGEGLGPALDSGGLIAAAASSAFFSSSGETGEYSFWTCPILRHASITGAPCLISTAVSKEIWEVTSGLNNPGAPSNTRRKATTAIVPITSRPVMISFLCNCIEGAFQDWTFSASGHELRDHGVFGLFEFFRFGFFNDLSLI